MYSPAPTSMDEPVAAPAEAVLIASARLIRCRQLASAFHRSITGKLQSPTGRHTGNIPSQAHHRAAIRLRQRRPPPGRRLSLSQRR